MRDAYGRDSLGEKALLARRLVEAGVTFVLVSGAWGYFDHHGDEVQLGRHREGPDAAAADASIARCTRWSTTWRSAACSTRRSS